MEISITTPGKELQRRFTAIVSEMHPELLKRAIRSGLQRVARQTRTQAKAVYEERVPGMRGKVDRAVGYKVHRDLSGFRVRVLKSGTNAMHVNRYGLTKPVAHFLEHGSFVSGMRMTRGTPGQRRGILEGAHAMEAAQQRINTAEIESQLAADIDKAAQRIINKYS